MTSISSRAFNQDVGRAKRAAEDGPVIVTDRGKPAFVLLTYEAYRQLAGATPSILDLLDQKAGTGEGEALEVSDISGAGAKPAMYS